MEAGATVPFAFLPWGAVPFPTLPWGSTPQTWPPILTELVGINNYLNSKILIFAPAAEPMGSRKLHVCCPAGLTIFWSARWLVAFCCLIFVLLILSVGVFTASTVSSFHTVFPSRSLLEEEKEINAKTPFFYGFGLWKKVTEISSKFSKNELPCR